MKFLSLSLFFVFSASRLLAQDGSPERQSEKAVLSEWTDWKRAVAPREGIFAGLRFLPIGKIKKRSTPFQAVSDRKPSIPLPLTPRIKIALFQYSANALKGSNINVDTDLKTHTVTLTGTVLSVPQKALAEAIARHNAGTFQVQNRLVVRPEQANFQPTVPLKYERVLHFMQLLAKSQGRSDGTTFGQRKTRFPDVKRLMSFVSARGVTIVDVNENGGKPLVLSRARLERDLKRTGSSAFDSFAYVGYIFAMPYAQYSQLTATPTRTGVVIQVANGHRLTWERENGRLQLRKLEYLLLEGD